MHTLTLVDTPAADGKPRAYNYTFAGSWAELTPEQLGRTLLLRAANLPPESFFPRLLRMLADLPARIAARMCYDDLLHVAAPGVVHIVQQLQWATTDPVFERSLLPTLAVRGRTWQGPKNQLKNFTVLQFSMADHCVEALRTVRTTEALHNALGALYHPADEAWDAEGIESRGRAMASLPLGIQLAAVFNYQAVRAALPAHFRRTFTRKDKDDDTPDFGVDGLVEAIAGDKFGDVDQAGHKRLTYALINSERAMASLARAEKEAEQPRR